MNQNQMPEPQKKPELKTVFSYEGVQFKLKNPSLLFRSQGDAYQKEIVKFALDYTANSKAKLLEIIPVALKELESLADEIKEHSGDNIDKLAEQAQRYLEDGKYKEFDELLNIIKEKFSGKSKNVNLGVLKFIDAVNAFNTDMQTAEELWFNNPDNIRRLFEIALDGPVEQIDHNPDTDERILAYDAFVEEVSNNFFMKVNSLLKRSNTKTKFSPSSTLKTGMM